jgi:hypothetical protein
VKIRLLAVSLLLAATLPLAHAFEGRVSLTMTVERGDRMAITYSLKGQKVRTELSAEGHQFASITDLSKLETVMLKPAQRQYIVVSLEPPIDKDKVVRDADMANADIKITGKTVTILGYQCNQVLVNDHQTVTEVWVTKELGAFVGMGQGIIPMGGTFGGNNPAIGRVWEEMLKTKGGFPLRVISRNRAGKQTFKLEATKIEPGPLPDSLLSLPAGYKKFDLPNTSDPIKRLNGN